MSLDFEKYELGDLCNILSSKRIFAREYVDSGVPFYRGKEIIELYNNREVSNELFITNEKYLSIKEKYGVPKEGDILLSSVGTLGIPFLVNNEKFYFKDGNLTWFKDFDSKIYNKFLFWWFQSPDAIFQINNKCIGSTQKALTIRILEKFEINLPPLAKQKKIVTLLENISNKIKVNIYINNNLESLAKSIYKYHFIDFEPYSKYNFKSTALGEIPENWSVQSIEEFVDDMKNGGTPKRGESDFWDNGHIPWLKTGEINNNIIIKSEEYITKSGLKNSSAKLLPKNSIILALYGKGTAARISLLKIEATTNQACCAMICNDFNKTMYLYLFLLVHQKEIENLATGSVQQNLSKDLIANLNLIIPPEEIIRNLPFKEIYNSIANNIFEIDYLTKLRDTLLPKLMSGEIDVSKINCDLD